MNLITAIPLASMRFESGAHPTLALQREARWPLVRGNATWLVPRRGTGPKGACPYCHERHPISLVCDDRPDTPLEHYEQCCSTCGHPVAYHGILGVVFCAGCGGPLRVRCEMDVGSAGFQMAARPVGAPPVGDGGPTFPEVVWSPTPYQADLDALEEQWDKQQEMCLLCKRWLPIRAFHYSQHEYARDYGGWRSSRQCRRCIRDYLNALSTGRFQWCAENTEEGSVSWEKPLEPAPTG